MTIPKSTKRIPAGALFLTQADAAPLVGSTRDRLIGLVRVYTHVNPIQPQYTVGSLVPDLDWLTRDINGEWNLQGRQRFFQGEIEGTWSINGLAGYIDLKRAKQP